MDFAPYQDTEPSHTRTLSPPPPANRTLSPSRNSNNNNRPQSPLPKPSSYQPSSSAGLPPPSSYQNSNGRDIEDEEEEIGGGGGGGGYVARDGRLDVNLFETSLPLRLDHEAMLAYLALPPAGGVALLVLEHRSDYVRFHAWQSSLLFSAIFVIHLIFSWSAPLSWILFVVDLGLMGFLAFKAYRDADGLDRFEVPFFGGLASSFVDSE